MKAWTDFPIFALGDSSGKKAPVRECEVLEYDGDKYCLIVVDGVRAIVKRGYLYRNPGRLGTPVIDTSELPPMRYTQ